MVLNPRTPTPHTKTGQHLYRQSSHQSPAKIQQNKREYEGTPQDLPVGTYRPTPRITSMTLTKNNNPMVKDVIAEMQ